MLEWFVPTQNILGANKQDLYELRIKISPIIWVSCYIQI